MSRGKTVLVTVIIAALVAVIDLGLYLLASPGFVVLSGALAVYGFIRGAGDFGRWLDGAGKSAPVTPPFDLQQEHVRRNLRVIDGNGH